MEKGLYMKEKDEINENIEDDGPGLDKQGAIYKAQQEGPYASPCEYCNRGDCMECAYAYKGRT